MTDLSLCLNGTWEMDYITERYESDALPEFQGTPIPNAVPGYWEDMTDEFALTLFYSKLQVNPDYGIQRYPMAKSVPDMALPNVMGTFFYRRQFLWDGREGRCLLDFEGVQNTAAAWLNGHYLGIHRGYSTPFTFDIPQGLLRQGENTLVLSVCNLELEGALGQTVSGLTNRAANHYTGGITGSIVLRPCLSGLRDAAVLTSTDLKSAQVAVVLDEATEFFWQVLDGTQVLLEGSAQGDFEFDIQEMALWSPETPKLYTLRLSAGEDTLERTFGLRRLTADDSRVYLNGTPVYLRGVCEHGYFPLTVHPDHDRAFYRMCVRKFKELGFNFIRFHTFIPQEEYMDAADRLGILVEVESPNNTSLEEWKQIVAFCRRHPCVVMYSCGNELCLDDPFIAHVEQCAQAVHENSDALFSPMSALRGAEYFWGQDVDQHSATGNPPRLPDRIKKLSSFSDVFNSYTISNNSYMTLNGDPALVDSWHSLYNRPRLSHEICIQGTYTDLSLAKRYQGTRVGGTQMFSSLEAHLAQKGVLKRAPLYFANSSQWQRRLRKHAFENARLSHKLVGYDFLGPIDTHWHTFGYDVGMMNEFYEMKPGETVRNVRMYNSATVLLTNLGTNFVFTAGQALHVGLSVSHFGPMPLAGARLNVRLTANGRLLAQQQAILETVENGCITELPDFRTQLPQFSVPAAMELYVTLEAGDTYSENQWELYAFPEISADPGQLLVSHGMSAEELKQALQEGRDVLLLGTEPFRCQSASFQNALPGRISGNLATVIADHPALENLPHDGFCGWQFRHLMEGAGAVCFEHRDIPFAPIIELVSTHKFVRRQGLLFEFRVFSGRLLFCGLNLSPRDPAARWLEQQLIAYAQSDDFAPTDALSEDQLNSLIQGTSVVTSANTNLASNENDKAAQRKPVKGG